MKGFFKNLFRKKPERRKAEDRGAQKNEPLYKKGDVIAGKYEVHGVLGEGGFGIVYLVFNRETSEVSALKTFRDELLANAAARKAFQKEALLWIKLEYHPFVLTARRIEDVSGRLFAEMEHIAPDEYGRVSLQDYFSQTGVHLHTNQILKWAIQFCFGMEHANSHGIECHRDIKPANILIGRDDNLKISDFGLAAAAEAAWLQHNGHGDILAKAGNESCLGFSLIKTRGNKLCGTPGYIPPEVLEGEASDRRSDVYSFGLVLWQMCAGSGVPPFMVSWPGNVEAFMLGIYERQMKTRAPRVNELLQPVIDRCLQRARSKRFSSFEELRQALSSIWKQRTGEPFEAPQIGEKTASFWINSGASFDALGQREEAVKCFDKALAINPRSGNAWHNKACSLSVLKRHKEAIACFDKALMIEPENINFLHNKGNLLARLGQHEKAIAACDKALAIDPQDFHAWSTKGRSLGELGQNEESVACYESALQIDPRNGRLRFNKGHILHKLGQLNEALNCFSQAFKIDPLDAKACYNKARTEDALSDLRVAIVSYRKFVELASSEFAEQTAFAQNRLQELERESL